MATHDQQQITKAQTGWLKFATNPEDCATTQKHLTLVLKLASMYDDIQDEDREAIQWVFYLLETVSFVSEEYVLALDRIRRNLKA